MLLKKILIIAVLLFFSLSSYTTALSFSVTKNTTEIDDNEYHMIKGVPYVGQEEWHYCETSAIEMVFRYYGINLSQVAILYTSGGGYSAAYNPRLIPSLTPPFIRFPHKTRLWTAEVAGGPDDYKFLAQLYGLQCKYIFPDHVTNHEKCWDYYWEAVKSYVKQDIPVITGLDPTAWPLYKEAINLSFTLPRIFAGPHMVVVVGFNETNSTVPGNSYTSYSKSYQSIGSNLANETEVYLKFFLNVSNAEAGDYSTFTFFKVNVSSGG